MFPGADANWQGWICTGNGIRAQHRVAVHRLPAEIGLWMFLAVKSRLQCLRRAVAGIRQFFFPGNSLTVSWGRGDSNALAGTLAFMSTGAAPSLGPSLHRHEVSKRKHLLHRAQKVLHRAQGLCHLTEEPSFPKGSTAMLEVFLPFLLPTSQSAKMCWDTNASVVSAALRIQGKKTG